MKKPPICQRILTLIFIATLFLFANTADSQIITTIAGNGTSGFSGDGGHASSAKLNSPSNVAVDASGNVYFADYANSRIRKINTLGIISTVAGNGTIGFSGDGGPATAAQFGHTHYVCLDRKGNIYISDPDNYRVRKVSTSGVITTIAGCGYAGYSGDGVPATAAWLHGPISLVCDTSGNLFIADCLKNCIRKVDTLGIITTIAGIPTAAASYDGDGGQATAAHLNFPGGLTFDTNGGLLFTDIYNHCIRKIDAYGIITTIAGDGIAYGSTGDGGPATAARIGNPVALAVGRSGIIYIADQINYKIRIVTPDGNINTFSGSGAAGYAGDGLLAGHPSVKYDLVWGLAIDGVGNIYIGDTHNHRVRKIWSTSAAVQPLNGSHSYIIKTQPNPSQGTFSITLLSPATEDVKLIVSDITGKQVQQLMLTTNKETEVQLNVPAGIYYLTADTKNGRVVEKIVVE